MSTYLVFFSKHFRLLLGVSLLNQLLSSCVTHSAPLANYLALPQPRKEVQLTSPEPLIKFEAEVPESKSYQLGAGDEITLEVWGYPDLSGKHIIGPDGRITLPLAGPVKLTAQTREAAAKTIANALNPYYGQLATTIRVDRYASNRVLVLGRVAKPGEVQFNMTAPTLLEAITLAGGFAASPGLEGAQSIPFTRAAVFRGQNKVVWIELEPLLVGKDLSLNLRLQRNDIVYVPEVEERLVYVLGEVTRPGALRLTPGMSFIEALAKAGGPTVDASPEHINLIRPNSGINQSLALQELIQPNNRVNVALQEGDILYVPANTIAKVNYVLQAVNPFTTALNIYANITSIQANTRLRSIEKDRQSLETDRARLEAEKAKNSTLE